MTIFGPDLSRYQQGIDIARIAAEGHSFVIAKVSQGASSRDPAWIGHRDGTRKAGLLLIGYHMVTGDDPAKQAANCKTALGDPAIPLALDWEQSGGSGNWANFVAVLTAFRAAGLNVRLAYCPRWYWQQQGNPDMSAIGLPLWSSRYVTTSGTPAAIYRSVSASQWQGYGGLTVALLQFTDHATIAGRSVDCSAFEGTRDQLAALLGAPSAAPPAPWKVDPMTDISITLAADGTFRETVMAEVAASSAVVARAWITYGSAWGATTFTVCALDSKGVVMPGVQKGTMPNNLRGVMELPSGCVMVTLEGRASPGARPAAALVVQPK